MSDILSSKSQCFWWAIGVCAFIIVVALLVVMVYKLKGLSASSVYLPGENIASPLERYDESNPEFQTLESMNKKRIAMELRRKSFPSQIDVSEQIGTKPPATPGIVTKEDVAKVSHDMTDGQKQALRMYLSGPLDTEAMNANVDPMYSVYRDTNYVVQ